MHVVHAEDWDLFPKPTPVGSSQPSVTPAPRDLMPTSVIWASALYPVNAIGIEEEYVQ